MLKKAAILILILILPGLLLSYKIGKFYSWLNRGGEFRFIGKVPKIVHGTFSLKAKTDFKKSISSTILREDGMSPNPTKEKASSSM